jgi:hypothetical protein
MAAATGLDSATNTTSRAVRLAHRQARTATPHAGRRLVTADQRRAPPRYLVVGDGILVLQARFHHVRLLRCRSEGTPFCGNATRGCPGAQCTTAGGTPSSSRKCVSSRSRGSIKAGIRVSTTRIQATQKVSAKRCCGVGQATRDELGRNTERREHLGLNVRQDRGFGLGHAAVQPGDLLDAGDDRRAGFQDPPYTMTSVFGDDTPWLR